MTPSRLVIAWPFYRSVSIKWFLNFMQMQKTHVVGQVSTQGIYLPTAMQNLVDMTFKYCGTDWEYMVVYEHDMVPGPDAFEKMAQYDPDQHDIVAGMYFKHEAPHHLMGWDQLEPPIFSPISAGRVREMTESPGLYPVDGVAMGFTAISRRVFERWDKTIPMWDAQPPLVGHDLWFCHAARQQGFNIWLDSSIVCGHLTEMPIGFADSQAALAAAEPPRWSDDKRPAWAGEGI